MLSNSSEWHEILIEGLFPDHSQRIATKEQMGSTDLANGGGFHLKDEAVRHVGQIMANIPSLEFDGNDYSCNFDRYLKQFVRMSQPNSPDNSVDNPTKGGPSIRQLRQQIAANSRLIAKGLAPRKV